MKIVEMPERMSAEQLIESILQELKGYVTDSSSGLARSLGALQVAVKDLGALRPELSELQAKLSDGSLKGSDGRDGDRGLPGEKGESGDRGEPGKDAQQPTVEEVRGHVSALLLGFPEIVADEVKSWLADHPPERGTDGRDGKDGTSVTVEQIKAIVEAHSAQWQLDFERRAQEAMQRAIEKIPIPRDGQHGRDGRDGKDGKNGMDGVSGKDGEDGLSVESLDRTYDKEAHEIVERWVAAGKKKELRYPAGGIRHGGYWREGVDAKAAETWTHAGIAWIAKQNTTEKPSRDSAAWEIFANKGRDGDNGKNGRDLGPPAPVKIEG